MNHNHSLVEDKIRWVPLETGCTIQNPNHHQQKLSLYTTLPSQCQCHMAAWCLIQNSGWVVWLKPHLNIRCELLMHNKWSVMPVSNLLEAMWVSAPLCSEGLIQLSWAPVHFEWLWMDFGPGCSLSTSLLKRRVGNSELSLCAWGKTL